MGAPYNYGVLIKPKVLLAMLAIYTASFLSSHVTLSIKPVNMSTFLMGLTAVSAAVSGANSINCYIDRDIDPLMVRTWGRPLVLGTIEPLEALTFSGILLAVASAISLHIGVIPFILFLEGAGSYILLYTMFFKRRTKLNVLATAPSVAAPAWFGWYMGGTPLYPVGLIMGFLVAVWGPLHLWTLAHTYSKDYRRVGVPMLTAILSQKKATRGILTALLILISSSYLLIPWTTSPAYTIIISITNMPLLIVGLRFFWRGNQRTGWWLFKLTAPYIIVVLFSFMFDKLLFI
jgi:protoheme IX farnesyltransferase